MKDLVTEAWLRANHTLSEGAEIHLPADSRLTPSARELLESRHLRIKFIDEQGRLFVDDEQQQPQPVHGLTSSDEHPQACCELCRQPVAKKPDTLTHLSAEKMVAKSDPRLGFRARVPRQHHCAGSGCKLNWRNRGSRGWRISVRVLATLCAPMRWGNRWAARRLSGFLTKICIGFLISRCAISTTIIWCRKPATGRDAALLNLLRTKVRETETVAAQVFITRSFEVLRPDILQALNRLSSTVYVMMILSVTKQPLTVKQIQQRLGETQ